MNPQKPEISLRLPYPVSANRYWRSYVPRGWNRALVVVSDEAKSYKSECGWIARAAGVRQPFEHAVSVSIRLVPKNRVVMDLDNALKVTIDALKGVCYNDDAQIHRIVAVRADPEPEARCEVRISEYVAEPSGLFA